MVFNATLGKLSITSRPSTRHWLHSIRNIGAALTFTDNSATDTDRTAGSYSVTGLSSGQGTGATFSVEVDANGVTVVNITARGTGYNVGDTIELLDVNMGSGGGADITVTVCNSSLRSTSMANVTVSVPTSNITVDTTNSIVNVASTTSNVTVSTSAIVDNDQVRTKISVQNVSGFGSLAYDSAIGSNGIIQYTGVSTSDIRTQISGTAPVTYNSATGAIGLDTNLDNITLKQFQETIVDNGTATGALTLDMSQGSIHLVELTGDITSITLSNINAGGTATIVFKQDLFGGHTINTASGFGAWNFMGGITDLDPTASSRSVLIATFADNVYEASISSPQAATTDDLNEGTTNLYFHQSANNTTTGNISASYFLGDGSQLTNVNTLTNAEVIAHIATVPLTVGGNITVNGNAIVTGNLEVTGNINYREVEDLLVRDQTITLNFGNATAQDAQIIVDRQGSALANVDLKWNETADRWQFSNDGSTYNNMLTSADLPADAVTSVNTQTGVVVLDTDNVAEGTTSQVLYKCKSRCKSRSATQVLT